MGRRILQYRYGTSPYTYVWLLDTEAPPAGDAVIVDSVDGNLTEIKQERKTPGHYHLKPVVFDIPAGKTRYKDLVIPDYTNGMDVLSCQFPTDDLESGDEIVAGKFLIGTVGQLAAPAAQGDTVVTVASVLGVLKTTLLGGALDEGFMLSFGVDDALDTDLNAEPPTKAELPTFEIKRLGSETPVGGGNAVCAVTLFTGLDGAKAAGTPVNLIVAFIKEPVPIVKNGILSIGSETLTAANCPANKTLRVGFKNNGAAQKTMRGFLGMLY